MAMRKSFRKFVYIVYLHGILEWVGNKVDNYKPAIIGVFKLKKDMGI